MNVIDVTPRPAALSAIVRFLQSRLMSILGVLFILTALKWGTLLFIVHQYETAIVTRFGKIIRTVTTPGLKIKLPMIDRVQRFDKRILAWDGRPPNVPRKTSSISLSIVSPGGASAIHSSTTIGSTTSAARSRAWMTF
jgi:hypothetical protein